MALRSFKTLAVITCVVMPFGANAFTAAELQACWGQTRNQSGSYSSTNGSGTFHIKDPGRIELHHAGGDTLRIGAQAVVIVDKKGTDQTYPLGTLGYLFRRDVSLARGGVVEKRGLANGSATLVVKPKSGGWAFATFNSDCRLVHLHLGGGGLPDELNVRLTHRH